MKFLFTTIAALSLALGSAQAGCGKTETDTAILKSYDKETKQLVLDVAGTAKTLTLTPSAKGGDQAESLVGKKVTVISEHKKVQSLAGA